MIARFVLMLVAITFSLSALARVNINTANIEELQTLKGIGEARAQAIVDYRNQHGPYRSLKELGNIPRFPDKLIDQLRNQMTVGPLEAGERPAPRVADKAPVKVEAAKPALPARPATPAKPASVSPEAVVERHETAAPPAPARPAMPARPPVAKPAASDAQPPSLQKPVAPAKPAMPAPAKPAVPVALAKPAVPAAPAASHEHEAAAHDEKPVSARPAMPAPARPAAVH